MSESVLLALLFSVKLEISNLKLYDKNLETSVYNTSGIFCIMDRNVYWLFRRGQLHHPVEIMWYSTTQHSSKNCKSLLRIRKRLASSGIYQTEKCVWDLDNNVNDKGHIKENNHSPWQMIKQSYLDNQLITPQNSLMFHWQPHIFHGCTADHEAMCWWHNIIKWC